MEKDILKIQIDDLKTYLYLLLSRKPMTDGYVVKCSQELDKLIVEYQKILNSNKPISISRN
ncbi:aspartyl-phosphate phosphatase Spo0E family protein [Clostridium sp. MSJ-4]|uniref:Aspartyl-phosphate phosphatase Spo0E family protein n=1 Tax=Clostridium simiarum TaxID=2841506 RepID=A0ABS6F5F4_9CLOT|nr:MULTISPECIES: aspartyl-phosphate phosphatase Spo0E family protein [Clostridium]MBU5592808.1 aspartyl-phosphate phosphatase Spo0E family protein [Clostridium simiarum]